MKKQRLKIAFWCFYTLVLSIANIAMTQLAAAQPLPQPAAGSKAGAGQAQAPRQIQPATSWDGQWDGDGHSFNFRLLLNFDAANRVTGRFIWTLKSAPPGSHVRHRIGQSGIEYVQGHYNPNSRALNLEGTRLEHDQLLALDAYQLVIAADGKSFSGVTRGNAGRWNNRIQARSTPPVAAPSAAPTRLFDGQWQGHWRGDEGSRYRFVLQLKVDDTRCSGVILWTKQNPVGLFANRQGVGQSGREYVSGTFDPLTWQLNLKGYRVDAPTLIGLDEYRLSIAKGDRSLSGVSRNHSGAWNSPMQGKYAPRPRR